MAAPSRHPRELTASEIQRIGAAARVQVLEEADLLGDPLAMRSEAIDEITALIVEELGSASSRVSIITPHDQRYLGATGLTPGFEDANSIDLDHSYCRYVVADAAPLVVEDAATHSATAGSPALDHLAARSYAGVPITSPDGHVLGSLCALDAQPRAWSSRDLRILHRLSAWVVMEVELRRRLTRMEAIRRERDALLSTIMHELHNPLMSIVGSARMLLHASDELSHEDRSRLLGIVRRHGERLYRMVGDLHVMAQVDAGRLPIDICDLSLREVVEAALEDSATRDGVERVEVPDVVVRGDRGRAEQVLVNVLTNARKYGRPPMTVVATRLQDRVELRVRDSGDGVPPEFVPQLFDRFARAPATATVVPGSGLGLAICRGFAREMGGDVRYEADPGGACFVFELPTADH